MGQSDVSTTDFVMNRSSFRPVVVPAFVIGSLSGSVNGVRGIKNVVQLFFIGRGIYIDGGADCS